MLTPPTGVPTMPEMRVPQWRPEAPPAPPAVPPAGRTAVALCACGHDKDAHEHYRPGSDCGACGADLCDEYRKVGGPVRRGLRRWGLVG